MGIDVHLMAEAREIKASVLGNKVKLMLPIDDPEFPYLRHIDAWGKAIYNRSQMPGVLEELHRLRIQSSNNDVEEYLTAIIDLCEQAASGIHLYICFNGD